MVSFNVVVIVKVYSSWVTITSFIYSYVTFFATLLSKRLDNQISNVGFKRLHEKFNAFILATSSSQPRLTYLAILLLIWLSNIV